MTQVSLKLDRATAILTLSLNPSSLSYPLNSPIKQPQLCIRQSAIFPSKIFQAFAVLKGDFYKNVRCRYPHLDRLDSSAPGIANNGNVIVWVWFRKAPAAWSVGISVGIGAGALRLFHRTLGCRDSKSPTSLYLLFNRSHPWRFQPTLQWHRSAWARSWIWTMALKVRSIQRRL